MKGLRKYLAPFAPDQSGASAVLDDLGGMIVICDAGGCAGNICGFDEPRWFLKKSAIFSAGLRDMDAILGRDDRLVEKLADAAKKIQVDFAAIIGTPVPAVIGTDYRALRRMAEKKVELPILTVETTGMELYDVGEESAWLELFRTFAKEVLPMKEKCVGIIGATPLEIHSMDAPRLLEEKLKKQGAKEVYCYGMGAGIDCVKKASCAERNLVIAPSGIKAASYLEEEFGTPYEVAYPLAEEIFSKRLQEADLDWEALSNKKVLILHQQVLANSIRQAICAHSDAQCTVASWFMLKKELKEDCDVHLKEEDDFIEYIRDHSFDLILGDEILHNAISDYSGTYINLPHFAVSGKI